MKCWLSLVSYFFAVLSSLRRYFRGHLSTGRKRQRRENKACSKTAGGRDLVQFKLELTPNHQNSHLENTGIRLTRYLFVPVPTFSEKSDPEVSKVAFSTWSAMIGARFQTKGIWRMRVNSNLPISASPPLASRPLGFWTANGRDALIGNAQTLNNISSVSQEYYNIFNVKEAKESNNTARIIKNTEEHFLCQSKIQQPF